MKTKDFSNKTEAIAHVRKLANAAAVVVDNEYIKSDIEILLIGIVNDIKEALKWGGFATDFYLRTRGAERSEKRIEDLHDTLVMHIKLEVWPDRDKNGNNCRVSWGKF